MNLPNILTLFRILLVPTFIVAFFSDVPNNEFIALGIFLLAGFTDIFDGYLARKYNLVTKFGSALDPLADKLMLMGVLICFTIVGYIPLFIVLIVIAKETFMIIASIFIYKEHERIVVSANKFGKSATVMFYIAIVVIIFSENIFINYLFLTLAVVLSIIAFISYFYSIRKKDII